MKKQTLAPSIEAIWERPLAVEEFLRRERDAIRELDGPEGDNLAALIRWFQRRYPTPRERLRYVRRKYVEMTGPARTSTSPGAARSR